MKTDYIITNEELTEKGIDLNEYALDGTFVYAIINMALDLAITRILKLNDNFSSELDIEKELDKNEDKVKSFKKLQHRVIYNLIFVGDQDPLDRNVNDIITYDLKWGKINGFQKGWF